MVAARATLPDLDSLDAEALKALVLAQHAQLVSRDTEIQHLQLLIAKLRRLQFGRKSERLDRQIAQLELRLEDLETNQAEQNLQEPELAHSPDSVPSRRPVRKPLPEHLPREVKVHEPKQNACPSCGG